MKKEILINTVNDSHFNHCERMGLSKVQSRVWWMPSRNGRFLKDVIEKHGEILRMSMDLVRKNIQHQLVHHILSNPTRYVMQYLQSFDQNERIFFQFVDWDFMYKKKKRNANRQIIDATRETRRRKSKQTEIIVIFFCFYTRKKKSNVTIRTQTKVDIFTHQLFFSLLLEAIIDSESIMWWSIAVIVMDFILTSKIACSTATITLTWSTSRGVLTIARRTTITTTFVRTWTSST